MSQKRNLTRIDEANQRDAETIGKYLPSSASEIFHSVVPGPDDYFTPPPWLLQAITNIASLPVDTPDNPGVIFDTTDEALDFNSKLLESFDNDLEALLANQSGTTLGYGSEFRPISQLQLVLGTHPNFSFFHPILVGGMPYNFTRELAEVERKTELSLQLTRGNHKSAMEKADVATRLLYKDVIHGFSLPVRASIVPNIKGAMVKPCGVSVQFKL